MDPLPKETSTAEATYCEKDSSVSETEKCRLDILATEASKTEYDHNYTERNPGSPKYFKNEAIHRYSERNSTTIAEFTSKFQEIADGLGTFSETGEESTEYASSKTLEEKYEKEYASEFSKELLFSVDVMTLVRHLNNLPFQWIIYSTSGDPDESPVSHILDEALGILWGSIKVDLDVIFGKLTKIKGIAYSSFQETILQFAEKTEQNPYDEKPFLMYCVAIAHWAACAEQNGVADAPKFVPLVICRTMQNLKDSGKIPLDFWERIAEIAVDIGSGVDNP